MAVTRPRYMKVLFPLACFVILFHMASCSWCSGSFWGTCIFHGVIDLAALAMFERLATRGRAVHETGDEDLIGSMLLAHLVLFLMMAMINVAWLFVGDSTQRRPYRFVGTGSGPEGPYHIIQYEPAVCPVEGFLAVFVVPFTMMLSINLFQIYEICQYFGMRSRVRYVPVSPGRRMA